MSEVINLEPTLDGYVKILKHLKNIKKPNENVAESIREIEAYLTSKGVKYE